MKIKKYAVIDQTNGDWFEEFYETEKEALAKGEYWNHLSDYDKERRVAFRVAVVEVEYDEDGDYVGYEEFETLKEYK